MAPLNWDSVPSVYVSSGSDEAETGFALSFAGRFSARCGKDEQMARSGLDRLAFASELRECRSRTDGPIAAGRSRPVPWLGTSASVRRPSRLGVSGLDGISTFLFTWVVV